MNKKVIIAAAILGMGTMAQAASVYSPAKGVICDKKSHFCVDSYGISMGLTKEYLGQKSVNKFNKMVGDIKNMDMTVFTLSNGLNCDTNKKICKKSKYDDNADAHWTRVLFNRRVGGGHNNHGGNRHDDGAMVQMEKDCKMYVVTKVDLPMAAVSVYRGTKSRGAYHIPVRVKWDEPFVDERGECKVVNGIVKRYKIID